MHLKVKCLILQSLIVRQTAMMETAQPPTVGVCSSYDDDDHHNHNYHDNYDHDHRDCWIAELSCRRIEAQLRSTTCLSGSQC